MSVPGLQRLLAPRSLALIGGEWADAALAATRVIGYTGEVWRIHPTRPSSASQHYFRSVDELPAGPDAAFVAAPAHQVPAIAAGLARRGAGGFVCFAAGFSETATPEGQRLTDELVASAGELPFFGPNCYGFVNFFDGATPRSSARAAPSRSICSTTTARCRSAARSPLAIRHVLQPRSSSSTSAPMSA